MGYNFTTVKRRQLEVQTNLDPQLSIAPSSRIMFGIYAGAKIFINNKVAFFGAIGISTAILQVEVSLKL